ncbi:venom acid phosphatase Acph-1-like [Athalia rosae]|uniref:venom acid phosphatase Acph-1-like n=1 Tax=Athalia rosae TaxID=37344 RepID=UPI00203345DB|nr:venom acid phosphatase Acph-1-like [Athalia rosae]
MIMRIILLLIPLVTVTNKVVVFGDEVGDTARLKLLVILFRHGDRTPEEIPELGDSQDLVEEYDFFPIGPGGLTNRGKLREFNLGRTIRSKYDKFLGPIYSPELVEARSTSIDRTKMSLQLVLNGIFPPVPSQQWKDGVDWQPFSTKYNRANNDVLMQPHICRKTIAAYNRFRNSTEYDKLLTELSDLVAYIKRMTGKVFTDIAQLSLVANTIAMRYAQGSKFPEWIDTNYLSHRLMDATSSFFQVRNGNDELRRLHGGALLRKIIDDFLKYRNGTLDKARKLYLYSGHDVNIVDILGVLGLWQRHTPQFSSSIIIELLEKNEQYFVKVIYYLGIPAKFTELQIPGCAKLCPLDELIIRRKKFIATNDDLTCE